jgi:transcriptional regulator with GAF, ATPase, and Fis domain
MTQYNALRTKGRDVKMKMTTDTSIKLKQSVQLRLLNELSTRLQSLISAEEFYQAIVDTIQAKFNYYSITIWSAGQDGSATLRAQAGAYSPHLNEGLVLQGNAAGITGWVIRNKKSYLVNDISEDKLFTNLSLPILSKSELCVPVVKDNEVIAAINVESDQTDVFDEEDVITLETVAAQVAVAISNRRLFREVKKFNSNLKKAVSEKTDELQKAHDRILQQQKLLQKENKALKTLVSKEQPSMKMIGQSPAITNILSMVDKIAPATATVLIQGESGTGKELIARRLHYKSDRAEKPYVTVNCGALQESLLESELFGHEKGSFTGAVVQKTGLAETADDGTLFLDEIGEMSLSIQAKLLRFLQEGEFYRIGGKRSIKVNVRVISATNRDLEQEVKSGRFREDLFYRLNTITLRMPPLRKRKEDIPMLLDHFLKDSTLGSSAHDIKRIDPKVLEVLQNYDWPGNIRELQNTIERIKILSEHSEIRMEDLPFNIRMPSGTRKETSEFSVELSLEEIEKRHIIRMLSFHQGNKTKTAHALGITIKTLYNKLHRYDMLKPPSEARGSFQPSLVS